MISTSIPAIKLSTVKVDKSDTAPKRYEALSQTGLCAAYACMRACACAILLGRYDKFFIPLRRFLFDTHVGGIKSSALVCDVHFFLFVLK